MTARDALQQAQSYLKNYQINDNSAFILLSHVLQATTMELLTEPESQLDQEEYDRFWSLIKRRSQHEPVWYLIGQQTFYGLPIFADARVLIPRPETEQLVGLVLDYAKDHQVDQIIDVGTGSGAIILAIADQLRRQSPDQLPTLLATDISADALAVARQNAANLQLDKTVEFVEASLLQPVDSEPDNQLTRKLENQTTILVANLPYIPSARLSKLQPDVRDHEPHLALNGGPDGLDLYRKLFQQLDDLNWQPQALFLEIDETQGQSIQELIHNSWPTATVDIVLDMADLNRFAIITL